MDTLPPIVAAAWLAAHRGDPHLVVLDASWYLPAMGRDARAEYRASHVPGARFFDLDAASDARSPLPHMLPAPEAFAAFVGALGIGNDTQVVVYDGSPAFLSAGRTWWMFRAMGHERVSVLDGGLRAWVAAGLPVAHGDEPAPTPATFVARPVPGLVRSLDQVRANLTSPTAQLLDARPAARFAGEQPEPRAGLRSGHIPGSRSLPYTEVAAADGTLLPLGALHARFAAAGVDLARPVVCLCGSGTSAGALALALAMLGRADTPIYDGSWTEWGGRDDTPVATGPA